MQQRRQAENTRFWPKALASTGESKESYEHPHLSDEYHARFTDLSDPPSPQHGFMPNHPLKSPNKYDHSSDPPTNFHFLDPPYIFDAATYRKPTSKHHGESGTEEVFR